MYDIDYKRFEATEQERAGQSQSDSVSAIFYNTYIHRTLTDPYEHDWNGKNVYKKLSHSPINKTYVCQCVLHERFLRAQSKRYLDKRW
jgi:hypothetical protein